MTPRRPRRGWIFLSTVVAAVVVSAAGWLVWYGTAASPSTPAPTAQAVTLAALQVPYLGPGAELVARAPAGSLPTRVVVESAGIDVPVTGVGAVQDRGKLVWETAWRAAGHHIDSARPGQPGNMVLTGHVSVADRDNLPVFATLTRAEPGDTVSVYSGDDVFIYRVTTISVVAADDLRVLRSSHAATVTLITCTADLKKRLVVVATLVPGA